MRDELYQYADEVDDLAKFQKELEPAIPKSANKDTVKRKAEQTSETVKKAKKKIESKIKTAPGIDRVMEVLNYDEELAGHGEPASYEEVRNDPAYAVILDEIESIVAKYKEGNLDPKDSESDVLSMASMLTALSQQLAIFQAQAADARSAEERQRVRAYVKAKLACIHEKAKMTDSDAKELAKYFALEYAERAANLEYVEKYLYNAFHSLRNFLDLLNFVVGRERRAAEKGVQF